MTSELSRLAALISSSVSTIETACEAKGIEVPSLKSIFEPEQDRAFRSASDATVANAIKVVVAATHQVNAILESPYATLRNASGAVRPYIFCAGSFLSDAISRGF